MANIAPPRTFTNSDIGKARPLGALGLADFLGNYGGYYPEHIAKAHSVKHKGSLPKSFALRLPTNIEELQEIEEDRDSEDNALSACAKRYIRGDMDGKHYYKALFCGREYCPRCGRNMSIPHRRRVGRLWHRWFQLSTWRYMVFTIHPSQRHKVGQKELQLLTTLVSKWLKKDGYDRGFARWHFAGEDGTTWHPHLNIMVEGGWLEEDDLPYFRNAWAAILEKVTGIYAPGEFNARYSTKESKACHWLKYIYRATYKGQDKHIWSILKGFRNTRTWGKFDKNAKPAQNLALETLKGFDLLQGKLTNIIKLDKYQFESDRLLLKLEYMGLGIWIKELNIADIGTDLPPPGG